MAKWISTEADATTGNTAFYAVPFSVPDNVTILSATITLHLAIDNYFGWHGAVGYPWPGLFVNNGPITGVELLGPVPIVTAYCDAEYSFSNVDIAPMVHPGANWLELYCMDWDQAAGIIFSAEIQVEHLPNPNRWEVLGNSLAGSAGEPSLVGTGTLEAGSLAVLTLSSAKPFAPSWIVIGYSDINAPFKGGVMVPDVNLLFALTTDFFGASSFGGLWPAGVPSGFTTYFQWWISDPAGPKGFSASNALAGTTP